jgi:hypothetical protein
MPAESRSPAGGRAASGRGRWNVRGGLAALAAVAATVLVLSVSVGHARASEPDQLLGMAGARAVPTYMLDAVEPQDDQAREYYSPPSPPQTAMEWPSPAGAQQLSAVEDGRQPAQDFPTPQAAEEFFMSEPSVEQQLSGVQAAEAPLANPMQAPNYNSGEGMTYMPSTQSGVSDEDQSPTLSKEFLDDEDKSKRRMKKLAKLLRKSAKKQDLLDVEVSLFNHSSAGVPVNGSLQLYLAVQ